MPPLYRMIEVGVYSILSFLPFLLLALYPFRSHLRFSKKAIAALSLLLGAIQICLGMMASFLPTVNKGILSVASIILYALFYFSAVKAAFGKTLFTLLMLSNIANMVITCSKCAEGMLFGKVMAMQSYRWTFSICLLIVSIIVTVPLFLYFRKYYSDGISKQAGAASWNYLWLIPATFYLLWFWNLYGSEKTALEIALEPSSALFILLINMGSFLIYHTVVKLINEMEQNHMLTLHTHQLAIQNLQYENLNRQIEATRQARHDLRHHIAVMDGYLSAGEYDKLREYLRGYKQSLPSDTAVLFCKHEALNLLLIYFAQQAKEKQIDFFVSAEIPEQINIPDNVLSVLFGNLLENALRACADVAKNPKISVKVKMQPDALFIQIENTYGKEPVKDKEGYYFSSKHKGYGVGLKSVKNITEQYGGLLEIEPKDGCFRVSVLLNIL